MITLFASMAGFITSLIPELIKLFKDRQDKLHELNIFDKQVKYSKCANSASLEEIKVIRDIDEQQLLYKTFYTGITWIDALNGSVRPVLAYSFFFLYSFIKYIQFRILQNYNLVIEYIDLIWSVDDQAIFASIISFYFGQRAFRKMSRRY